MGVPKQIKGRYEIREVLGQGGMGVVYNAFDSVVKRSVALKTVRDTPSRSALELFYKECAVLASISHPNIVEIFDLGEFDDDGAPRPYFVMPLLAGNTLGALISARSNRLDVGRVVDIFCQACRGLHAAHERGLVHRDVKPSNIFVLDDDSVKIIDFGIARTADAQSTAGHKGTLLYMSPEQVDLQAPSPLSDIFSAAVVAYEALTLRHPFERSNAAQVASAIKTYIPPPASELNPLVNAGISRVIHKAMAKQPWYRFANAREFSECLQKAAHNEPIEIFDPSRIQPALERARKAFQQGDFSFADEILTELEVQGQFDEGIPTLRRCVTEAQRRKTIDQLLESARTRAEQREYALALQKLQELLALDPAHAAALELKNSIESSRMDEQIDEWFRLAHQHIQQKAFQHARQALQNVLRLHPNDEKATRLLAEVDRSEQEFARLRQEQDQLYANAMEAWQHGEISVALSKMERLIQMGSSSTERSAHFQNFYNQVRSEHDALKSAYEQARRHLADGNFDEALRICEEQQSQHPGHALIQSLKFDIEERRRQELSRRIAEVDRTVEQEPDLDKRVSILTQAVERNPGEAHFERALRTSREKRDLVNSIVNRARANEDRGQYQDAQGQWEIVRTIYPQYLGLDFEIERVRHRLEQQLRSNAKSKWIEQIDWKLGAAEYAGAAELVRCALAEFPEDPELLELAKLVAQRLTSVEEAQRLLSQAEELRAQERFADAIELLRRAHQADSGNPLIRAALANLLVTEARGRIGDDWHAADTQIQEALELEPENAAAKSLRTLILDRRRDEFVSCCATQARRLQGEGQVERAIEQVEQALGQYPTDARLLQLRASLTRDRPQEALPLTEAQPAPFQCADDTPTIALPQPEPSVETPPVEPTLPAPEQRKQRDFLLPATAAAAAVILLAAYIVQSNRPPRARPTPRVEVATPNVVAPPPPTAIAPPKTTVFIYANLATGRVVLDDQPMGDLRDGYFLLDNVGPRAHTLKIGGYREQVTVNFDTAEGKPPSVQSLLPKEASVIAIASEQNRAWVHSDLGSVPLTVDSKPGEIGQEIAGLVPGIHQLVLGEGQKRRTQMWSLEPGPALTVFVTSDRNVGTLIVVTGESGVRVWLNGKEQASKTQDGRLRIPGLNAANYTVRVAKEGFMEVPEKQAAITKGDEVPLQFELRPLPVSASLAIVGGTPGAEVRLDQALLDLIRADGSLSKQGITPGTHSIELRKQGYRSRTLEKRFEQAGVVQLSAAEATLDKLPGGITLNLTPANANVTISSAGGTPRPFSGGELPEGTYTVIGRAPDYDEASRTFTVVPGESQTIALTLGRKAAPMPPPVDAMSLWDNPGAWTPANDWYVHKGGNFVAFKPTPARGVFQFRIRLDKGKRLRWAAAWRDDRNYVLFQMDKKYFYRSRVVNGKEGQEIKTAHPFEKESVYTVQIDIEDDAITHRFLDGTRTLGGNEWPEPGAKFATGKFGFLVPGNDAIAISGFRFTQK